MWMRIAERLHMSESRAMAEVTSTGYLRWIRRFRDEMNEPSRADYYAAQTAYHVNLLTWVVCNMFNPRRGQYERKPDDFLIKFEFGDDKESIKHKKVRITETSDVVEDMFDWHVPDIAEATAGVEIEEDAPDWKKHGKMYFMAGLGLDCSGSALPGTPTKLATKAPVVKKE